MSRELEVCGKPEFGSNLDIQNPKRTRAVHKFDIRVDGFSDRNCVQSIV